MLRIDGLTKYFGGLSAVNKLDFTVNQGEAVGLIGPNGAGKTTTFNLITGFLRATSGAVIFEGKNLVGEKPHAVAAKGIVRTFQGTSIFPGFTVLQSLVAACYLQPRVGFWEAALHRASSRKKETEVLDEAHEILRFVGLEQMKDLPAPSLPHGHKRILGIATALAAHPKLLLLDEPLSGMNSGEVAAAMELINKIWSKGTTILLIEHNMRAAMRFCQRIVVLNFGVKIAEGAPKEVRENKDVIQAYLGMGDHAGSA
jgi:branched-chain amino acid transport system ATP-binding protein